MSVLADAQGNDYSVPVHVCRNSPSTKGLPISSATCLVSKRQHLHGTRRKRTGAILLWRGLEQIAYHREQNQSINNESVKVSVPRTAPPSTDTALRCVSLPS